MTPTSTPNNYSCDMRCAGNEPEICGGAGVISIYNNTDFTPPSIKPSIGKYHPAGCATDPNTNGRALQGASTTSPQMTEEMCVKFCLGHEFHYAGYVLQKVMPLNVTDKHTVSSTARNAFATTKSSPVRELWSATVC